MKFRFAREGWNFSVPVADKKEGHEVSRGERLGMIRFGSRVDVFFPPRARVRVQPGAKARVGLTVLAKIPE